MTSYHHQHHPQHLHHDHDHDPHQHLNLLFSKRSEYESSQSGAADCNPRGEGTFLLEVNGDADDGGEVDEAEAEAGEDAHSEVEDDDALGRGGERHPAGGQDGSGNGDHSAAIFVGEVAGDGTWKYQNNSRK